MSFRSCWIDKYYHLTSPLEHDASHGGPLDQVQLSQDVQQGDQVQEGLMCLQRFTANKSVPANGLFSSLNLLPFSGRIVSSGKTSNALVVVMKKSLKYRVGRFLI